ncbi:NigD-like protein [Geofilum sp. OHC36d9]|uniref:NigD-like protein n=1 Tax=Geofilum sp. OHC36d9 TaxID=3458413 RepID=UPI004033F009
MNRNVLRTAILLLGVLFLQACEDDNDYSMDHFWVTTATIDRSGSVHPYLIVTDNGDRLFPSASVVKGFDPDDGQRIWVNYTILGDAADEFDYYVKINDVSEILTKGVFTLTSSTADSIGNDPVKIKDVWLSGNYLNVGFVYGGGGAIHFINLIQEESKPLNDDGYPILEFRHNRNQDLYNYAMKGWVSFDLSDFREADSDSFVFELRAKSFSGEEPFEKLMTLTWNQD